MAEFYQTTLLVDRENLFQVFYRSGLHVPTGPDGKTPSGQARNQVADARKEEGEQHQGVRHLPRLLGSTRLSEEGGAQEIKVDEETCCSTSTRTRQPVWSTVEQRQFKGRARFCPAFEDIIIHLRLHQRWILFRLLI